MYPNSIALLFKKLVFILVLTLLASQLFAQANNKSSIKGVVVDEQKTPLPYATIVLKNTKDSGIYRSALSNEKGAFAFTNLKPGNYFLELSMIGFEKLVKPGITIGDTEIDMGILILKRSTNALKEVTIKADVPLIERQIDKTVVNVAQNITNDGSTVLEVMQKLPGVQVSPDGQITLDGKPGVNVYIDGKATYLSAEDLVNLLGGMQASTIQKVEIMTNPSSKYDAAGTAGIINIIKKKNRKEGLNGSVNGGFGESYYSKYNGGLTLSYKTENYNIFFNNTYSYNKTRSGRTVTSDILNPDNSLLIEEASQNYSSNTNKTDRPTLGIDLCLSPKTTLTLSGTGGIGLSDNPLTSNMNILDSNRVKTNTENFKSDLHDSPINYTTGIQLVQQLDTLGRQFTVNFDYSNYRNMPIQNNFTTLNDAEGNFISETDALLLQQRHLDIYEANADYEQPLNKKGRLETGIKSSYVKAVNDNNYYDQVGGQNLLDSAQTDYSVNTENINAAYININQNFKKLTVQAGLRGEQTIAKGEQLLTNQVVKQNYFQLFPTLFFDYKLNDQSTFNIKLGRRTERAEYSEMVPFRRPQTATLYFQGNPNLKPQLSWHAEATWSFQSALYITFNYDIYRDYIRTFPYLDSNKTTITRIPTNVQGAHALDIDIGYSKKLTDWWSTDNTLSIYQTAFNGSANGYSLDNNGILSVYLSTNNSFQLGKKLAAECDFEYDSKRQFINSTFGPYSILSFGLKQSILADKGSISLNARNILQSEGHNAIDRNAGLYQYSEWYFYTRSVSFNFTYRFGTGKVTKATAPGESDVQGRAGGN